MSATYLRYVRHIYGQYQPKIFSSVRDIRALLADGLLINQSSYRLRDAEIEALLAGLGFVPTEPLNRTKEKDTYTKARDRLVRSIDIRLALAIGRNDGSWTDDGRRLKSHIYRTVPSKWQPPSHDWREPAAHWLEWLERPTPKSSENARRGDTRGRGGQGGWRHHGKTTHREILVAIDTLRRNQDIHILPADKGGATVIMNRTDYDREALRQLSDRETYEPLTREQYEAALLRARDQLAKEAENLLRNGHITKNEKIAIANAELKGSSIYFLPKVHKEINAESRTFAGRPIAATHSAVVHTTDKYITEVTKHLLPLIPGSLQDTTDLLIKLPRGRLPSNATIVTADVVSLYPTIPWEAGFLAATNFYTDHFERLRGICLEKGLMPPPDPATFGRLLRLVLSNSLITFKGETFYHQKRGTAMGMCISVFFANAYMYHVTSHHVHNPPPGVVTFLRYIDDLIVVFDHNDPARCEEFFRSITTDDTRYTVDPQSRSVSFLDVRVTINELTHCIETEPYYKPTSTFSYLHARSNHPWHCIASIPLSQYIRLRRICSSTETFIENAKLITTAFTRRGYPYKILKKHFEAVMAYHRSEVLGEDTDTLIERALRRSAMPEGVTATPYLPRSKREEQQAGQFRMIVPYSSLINDGATRDALDGLAETIRTHYGDDVTNPGYGILPREQEEDGSGRGKSGIDLVHSKRQATATRFTRIIKDPLPPRPDGRGLPPPPPLPPRPTPQEHPETWDPHRRRKQRNASRADRRRRANATARYAPYDAAEQRTGGGDNRVATAPLPLQPPLVILD